MFTAAEASGHRISCSIIIITLLSGMSGGEIWRRGNIGSAHMHLGTVKGVEGFRATDLMARNGPCEPGEPAAVKGSCNFYTCRTYCSDHGNSLYVRSAGHPDWGRTIGSKEKAFFADPGMTNITRPVFETAGCTQTAR
jgi:hypothetical protein